MVLRLYFLIYNISVISEVDIFRKTKLLKLIRTHTHTHTHTHIYIYIYIQGVPGGMCKT